MNKNRLLMVLVLSIIIGLISFYWSQNLEKVQLDDTIRATAPGQFMALSDGRAHYLLDGPADGIPVVLIHGVTVPSLIWDQTAKELAAEGFRVLRPDLYGRGFSDRPRQRYTRELFSGQVAELAEKIFSGRPYSVVGISLGGAIAADVAANHSASVERLVLVSPFTIGFNVTPLQVPLLADYLATGMLVPKLLPGLQNLFADPALMPADWRERYSVQLTIKGFRRSFISTLVNFSSRDQLDLYTRIGQQNIPVMLAWGTEDHMTPYELHRLVIQAIPRAEFHSYDGAGHVVHIERAAEFIPHLSEFLNRDRRYAQSDSATVEEEPVHNGDDSATVGDEPVQYGDDSATVGDEPVQYRDDSATVEDESVTEGVE